MDTDKEKISTLVTPSPEALGVLSRDEMERLRSSDSGGVHASLRACALAILSVGDPPGDDAQSLLERHADFELTLHQRDRGLALSLENAPGSAFVDGHIIRNIGNMLFAAVRDLAREPAAQSATNEVFDILRNASLLHAGVDPSIVVCWGGHAISGEEYDYTKEVGYRLGLRGLDICTGCGPGAMKGPMKGAAIAHAKQHASAPRYIGVTEPGIIASESPNPIVNRLVIMPDIEMRLEAFVRMGHAFVVFPGGVGTAEEILYLLGILLDPRNEDMAFPLVITGPASSGGWLDMVDAFLRDTLGEAASRRYVIVKGDPEAVAAHVLAGLREVKKHRIRTQDAFFFNWGLSIQEVFQSRFAPTHANMQSLRLYREAPPQALAADLRRAFSGIVAGNVKPDGLAAVAKHGPFRIHGDPSLMRALDTLLRAFVGYGRMRLPGREYVPCYEVVSGQ